MGTPSAARSSRGQGTDLGDAVEIGVDMYDTEPVLERPALVGSRRMDPAPPPQPWDGGGREEFGGRFGEDADAYDRTRPVAPPVVFDDIVRLAGLRSGSEVLEIGPGTGQVTWPLAERGLRVLALEPDPRLAALASLNLAGFPQVSVTVTSFEAWEPGDATFDAVVACNAFHWVDPDIRLAKAAAVLRPQRCLVVMTTPVVVPDDAERFWWDVQDDWVAVGADRLDPATMHPDRAEDEAAAIRASGHFEEPTVLRHRFDVVHTAEDYAINLSTQSGVKTMPAEAQPVLVERIRRRIEAGGGVLTVHHLAAVTIARVRGA
jgi:SAM-dependent methyltransferase